MGTGFIDPKPFHFSPQLNKRPCCATVFKRILSGGLARESSNWDHILAIRIEIFKIDWRGVMCSIMCILFAQSWGVGKQQEQKFFEWSLWFRFRADVPTANPLGMFVLNASVRFGANSRPVEDQKRWGSACSRSTVRNTQVCNGLGLFSVWERIPIRLQHPAFCCSIAYFSRVAERRPRRRQKQMR